MNMKLLKQKDFLLLIQGKFVSLMGSQMQSFALSLYVLKVTGSAAKFASVLAVSLIPQIVLGPIAGVFVDWFDRKKLIVYLDILSGIVIGIFVVIYKINGALSLPSVYILTITMTLISILFNPAINTIIPTIIKKEELVDANGINSFIMSLGSLAAPAIAGVLLGIYGIYAILILNSISFILSSIFEMFINIPKVNKKPEKINYNSFRRDFSEGINFIKSKKIMMNVIMLAVVINFAINPVFNIGLTYISKSILKITDSQYGLLESIFVISMIVAPFLCSIVSKKIKLGKILFLDIFINSILVAIMAIIPSSPFLNLFGNNFLPYISLITIGFLVGLVATIGNIAFNTMLQQVVPLSMMGRVSAVMGTGCMAAIPLGQIIYGFLFDKIEAWMCVGSSAVILFITILAFKKVLCNSEEDNQDTSIDTDNININLPEMACLIDNGEPNLDITIEE